MANLIVVTDRDGQVIGTVRRDAVRVGNVKLQFHRPPQTAPGVTYHEMEVPDDLLNKSAEEIHSELRRQLRPGR